MCSNSGFFANCTSLRSISVPQLAFMSGNAGCFYNCTALESFSAPNLSRFSYYWGSGIFANCIALSTVYLPECAYVGGPNLFQSCINLTSVYIPKLAVLSDAFFSDCHSLSEIDLTSITSIGNGAFTNCSSLQSLNLLSCTSIGASAFQGCVGLEQIILNSYLNNTNSDLFKGCAKLSSVTFMSDGQIYFPPTIYAGMLDGCQSLSKINSTDLIWSNSAYVYANGLRGTGFSFVQFWSSVTLRDRAFAKCSNLNYALFMSSSMPSVQGNVFYGTPLSKDGFILVNPDVYPSFIQPKYYVYGTQHVSYICFSSAYLERALPYSSNIISHFYGNDFRLNNTNEFKGIYYTELSNYSINLSLSNASNISIVEQTVDNNLIDVKFNNSGLPGTATLIGDIINNDTNESVAAFELPIYRDTVNDWWSVLNLQNFQIIPTTDNSVKIKYTESSFGTVNYDYGHYQEAKCRVYFQTNSPKYLKIKFKNTSVDYSRQMNTSYGGQYDYIPGGHSLSIGKPDATNSGQVTYLHTFDFIAGSTTVPHVDEDTLIFALKNYNLNPSTPHFVDITFTHRVILDADFEFTIEELPYQEFTDEELNNLTISIGQAGAAPEGENN